MTSSSLPTTTTTTTTYLTIFRVGYIRQLIFKHVEEISERIYSLENRYLKGRDIKELEFLGMITEYAMPWQFIKHYLPSSDHFLFERRMNTITRYCSHQNATLDTLLHLLEWSPDFNPNTKGLYPPYYQDLAHNIASNGHVDILDYMINKYSNNILFNSCPDVAAENGHLPMLKLLEPFIDFDHECLETAVSNQHHPIITFLVDRGVSFTDHSLELACQQGDLDLVKLIHQNRPDINADQSFMNGAIAGGHIEIVKSYYTDEEETTDDMDLACENGHFSIVEWLHQNTTAGCTTKAMDKSNSLQMIQFLHYNRTEGCTTDCMDNAVTRGDMDIVQFLHQNRTEGCTSKAMDRAKSLQMIQFLHYNRTEGCTTDCMNHAVTRGDMDIVQFLHQNRQEGCTTRGMDNVVVNGHIDMLKYLFLNRTERPSNHIMNYVGVVQPEQNGFEIIKFLYDYYKIPFTAVLINNCCTHGRLDIIQYIHQSLPTSPIWTKKAMDKASENGYIDIVKVEGCTTDAMDKAAERYIDIVKVCYHHHTNHSNHPSMDIPKQPILINIYYF
ncbi:hypothetical protein DFA_09357 [Cavenderia fasciculata]|uniref:Ankyrin repeat-containing protein n=1 Tax=Cavenderia fasciculata TaxID=261658 RepID=F4Q7E5_CACFS|nr:uncharacterized protein DFA_09357 [Cavenderia fasciculata]EGG16327.1 hypothetical protein DFA_09357 [Cavenderia fasciculata]|eukprot:XP_004354711.1 hypothetical protein DFA_09357 [Cavenderia fasciculata]